MVSAKRQGAEMNDGDKIIEYTIVQFAAQSKLLPLHFIQVATKHISGVHSGVSDWLFYQYTSAVFEMRVCRKI